jgi:plasmid stability protein
MNAAEIRNATHAAKRSAHAENRAAVLDALASGSKPVSTRALAALMGWDVLAVRPRVTELYQEGLVVLEGKGPDGGLYRAATVQETLAYQSTRLGRGEVQDEMPFQDRRRRY